MATYGDWQIVSDGDRCPDCGKNTVVVKKREVTSCKAPCSYDPQWRTDTGYDYQMECPCGYFDCEPADLSD